MILTKKDFFSHPFFKSVKLNRLSRFVENYRTPVFIYSAEAVLRQINLFKKNIPGKFKLFYAQKSNPNPSLLRFINTTGIGCDTASLGEIKSAIKAGFSKDRIMFTGPGKTEKELSYAISNNLLSINVESFHEIEIINRIAKRKERIQDIMLRINPAFEAGETTKIIGGKGTSKFGIDYEQIPEVISGLKNLQNVNLCGIHIFNSSGILDYRKILKNTKDVIRITIELEEKFNLNFKRIDLGGGFGIPYSKAEKELDIKKLGNGLKKFINKKEIRERLKNKELVFELGRYISAYSGVYLTKVLYTKKSCGKNIAIIDGGIHHLLRPALIGQSFPVINLSAILQNRKSLTRSYLIAGPLCTSLDEIDSDALMNEVTPGDILAVLNCGAYGYTESMPLFLTQIKSTEYFMNK